MQHFSLPTLQCKLQCKVYIAKCAVLFVISSKRECYFCDQAILFEVKKWVWIIYCKHKPSKASEEDVLVIKCCPQILKKHQLEKKFKETPSRNQYHLGYKITCNPYHLRLPASLSNLVVEPRTAIETFWFIAITCCQKRSLSERNFMNHKAYHLIWVTLAVLLALSPSPRLIRYA